ncbi:hypothetical protein ABBQ38_009818 [Trebouxia sp. C0009 RCD-2024]
MITVWVDTSELQRTGIGEAEAARLHRALTDLAHQDLGSIETWRNVTTSVLTPHQPFALHSLLFKRLYSGWPHGKKGPPPVWVPDKTEMAKTNLAGFMVAFEGSRRWQQGKTGNVTEDWRLLYQVSCTEPEVFWPPVLQQLKVIFHTDPKRIFETARNPDCMRWLPGAKLNIAETAVCNRNPDDLAIMWADEASPRQVATISRGQLKHRCQQVAAALAAAGFNPGAAIAINMPMTVDAVVIYLGIIYAGCTAVSIADSFAPSEISTRLRIANTKAIFVQDVILRGGKAHPLYERVVKAQGPTAIVLPSAPGDHLQVQLRPGDMSYAQFLSQAEGHTLGGAHVADASDTCNILFSSGTTGQPKAIPWTHTTPIRCAANAFFHQDVRQGDTVAWPTNLGWMMGPWLVFAALLNGAAIALFQGSPLGRDFGVFVQAAGVSMLGLVPSIAKAWRASDCMKGLNWDKLRCFSSTGEASSPEDYHWLAAMAGYKPVIEYCGGTEIGGGFLGGTMVQPQAPSHFSTPTIGCRLALLDDQTVLYDSLQESASDEQGAGRGVEKAVSGEVALVPPLLGSSQRLLNKDHDEVYYQGMPALEGHSCPLRRHGDEVERLPGGFYVAHGRCDDTMNLGGIKVSSVELERVVIAAVPAVMEAAAVGVTPPGGGPEQLVMFLVLHHHTLTTAVASAQAPARGRAPYADASQNNASFLLEAQPGAAGSQDAGCDHQQGKAGTCPKAAAPSSDFAGGRGQDGQATDVGVSPRLDGLWEAISLAKVAAASAASKVADLAAAAVQTASTDPRAQQGATAQEESNKIDLQRLKLQCQQAISASLNPLFKLDRVLLRDSLPRTASNKVMRRLLRDELRLTSAKL